MKDVSFIILYVENPKASEAFYADLLGRQAVDASPNFVMFAMASGLMLGLWKRTEVEPAVSAAAGGSEIAFAEENKAAVDARCADWRKRGLTIVQQPTDMDFGRTFVALDPDGHRLRVFTPSQA